MSLHRHCSILSSVNWEVLIVLLIVICADNVIKQQTTVCLVNISELCSRLQHTVAVGMFNYQHRHKKIS